MAGIVRRAVGAVALLIGATSLGAQQAPGGRCDIEILRATDSSRSNATRSAPNAPRQIFFGGGFLARCLNQDVRLAADSAEYYEGAQVLYLIGRVRYTEPRVRMTSDRASYDQNAERLVAEGNVDAVLPSGSTMRGPVATYLRAVRGLRPQSVLEAPNRPRFTLVQKDDAGKPAEPVLIVADRVTTFNDSIVHAGGRVEITRTDFDARSDSAYMDTGIEFVRLLGNPVVRGKGERSYTLRGTILDIFSKDRLVQRVLAKREARATSEDLLLTSDTIDLRLADNKVQEAAVWGASRARAVSPDRDLVADSIWVRMPGQSLRELRAFREAVAQTVPDTATIRTGEKDWLRADTIVAWFDSTRAMAAGDSAAPRSAGLPRPDSATRRRAADDTATVRLVALEGRGRASARTQVAGEGSTPEKPGINYARGRTIRLVMDSTSEVDRVEVDDDAVGVYLEPIPDAPPVGTPSSPATPAPRAPTPTRPATGRP
jgi:hypothetical protein